jgi:alcohol dehydrogenase
MRHVVFQQPGQLAWREAPDPQLQGPDEALIRPVIVGRCDLDRLYLSGRMPLAPGEPIGHEIIGDIVALGERAAQHFKLRQRVIVAAQVSCGVCPPCLRGATARCSAVPFAASYGMGRAGNFGGGLAECVRVPFARGMLTPIPANTNPIEIIGLADMASDAWRAVGPQLATRPGASVLVTSGPCPVISLFAVGLAISLGAEGVDYIDVEPARRQIAQSYGAHAFEHIGAASGPYDIVVDGANDPQILRAAFDACAADAAVTSIAPPFTTPDLQMMALYHKGITWRIARPDCRAGHASVLSAWSSHGFRPQLVTPKLYAFDAAIEAWLDPALYVAVALQPADSLLG